MQYRLILVVAVMQLTLNPKHYLLFIFDNFGMFLLKKAIQ